jgi:hypothetical protein
MSKEARISINIDAKKAIKSTDDLEKSVGQVADSTKKATTQLREMQDALTRLEPGTEEFRKMAREAGQLQDQINKARNEIRAFSEDTFALQGTVGVVQGVTSAYSSATATMALFGAESEELIQVFARLELIQRSVNGLIATYTAFQRGSAAMTFLQTARTTIYNSVKSTSNRIDEIANRLTQRQTILTGAQTVATNQATFATRALSTAMKALPIVAILGGLTALVGMFVDFGNSVDDATESMNEFNDTELAEKRFEVIKSGFENEKKEIDDINSAYNDGVAILKNRLATGTIDQAEYTKQLESLSDRRAKKIAKETGEIEKRIVRLNKVLMDGAPVQYQIQLLNQLGVDITKFGQLSNEQQREILQSALETERAALKAITEVNELKSKNREKEKADGQKARKEQQQRDRAALEEDLKLQEFYLLQSSLKREEQIKEIVDKNSFERQFFGEADPGGRLAEIYASLDPQLKKSIIELADKGVEHLEGAIKESKREKLIWAELFSLDEVRDNIDFGSIIDVINETQSKLGKSYSMITDIIDEEYNEQINLLQTKLDKEFISQREYDEEVFKLEKNKLARIKKLDDEILKSNTKMNDLRNQATQHQFDLEIRELELLGDQKEEIEKRQHQKRFDEELKRTAELFGRNSQEYLRLVELQYRELSALEERLENERSRERTARISQDLRSLRDMTNMAMFSINDAVNGSFESMRFGFNSLRDQMMDPDTGLLAMIKSFEEGFLSSTQLILTGMELMLSSFDTYLDGLTKKNLARNQKEFDQNTEHLKSQLANRVISQEQFNDRMSDLEDQKRVKEIA